MRACVGVCGATPGATVGLLCGRAYRAKRKMTDTKKPRIAIVYCRQCNWLLRAAWMAQEILSTFGDDVGEVALLPSTGGAFRIEIDDDVVWDRKRDGGFPDVPTLKQIVRDRIDPERSLGHADRRSDDS